MVVEGVMESEYVEGEGYVVEGEVCGGEVMWRVYGGSGYDGK